MDLEGIKLSEVNKMRKTNNVWYHLYVESKIYRIKQKRNRLMDTKNKLVVTSGEKEEGG